MKHYRFKPGPTLQDEPISHYNYWRKIYNNTIKLTIPEKLAQIHLFQVSYLGESSW